MWSLPDRGCCHCNNKENSTDDNFATGKIETERGKRGPCQLSYAFYLSKRCSILAPLMVGETDSVEHVMETSE